MQFGELHAPAEHPLWAGVFPGRGEYHLLLSVLAVWTRETIICFPSMPSHGVGVAEFESDEGWRGCFAVYKDEAFSQEVRLLARS
eukprot:1136157-Pelagomonas_calceolata.AAC.13